MFGIFLNSDIIERKNPLENKIILLYALDVYSRLYVLYFRNLNSFTIHVYSYNVLLFVQYLDQMTIVRASMFLYKAGNKFDIDCNV
jgi:hypothetical protein